MRKGGSMVLKEFGLAFAALAGVQYLLSISYAVSQVHHAIKGNTYALQILVAYLPYAGVGMYGLYGSFKDSYFGTHSFTNFMLLKLIVDPLATAYQIVLLYQSYTDRVALKECETVVPVTILITASLTIGFLIDLHYYFRSRVYRRKLYQELSQGGSQEWSHQPILKPHISYI